ncbi:MAG: hypothetical protein RJB68_1115 [Pseudomonadota bacterium]
MVQDQIKKGQLDQLPKFQLLGAVAQQAHPSHEHYLPLLVAAGRDAALVTALRSLLYWPNERVSTFQ